MEQEVINFLIGFGNGFLLVFIVAGVILNWPR